MLYEEGDPYTCYGGEENGNLIDRKYSGTVLAKSESDSVAVITARAISGVLYLDGRPLVTNYRRDFVVLGETNPILLIITRGEAKNGSPYLNFVFPSGEDVRATERDMEVVCRLGENLAFTRVLKLRGQDTSHHLLPLDGSSGAMRFIQCFPADCGSFVSVAVCETEETGSDVIVHEGSESKLLLSVVSVSSNRYVIDMPSLEADIIIRAV
jgi:hypothetical protein